jgi:hypothetical protein
MIFADTFVYKVVIARFLIYCKGLSIFDISPSITLKLLSVITLVCVIFCIFDWLLLYNSILFNLKFSTNLFLSQILSFSQTYHSLFKIKFFQFLHLDLQNHNCLTLMGNSHSSAKKDGHSVSPSFPGLSLIS